MRKFITVNPTRAYHESIIFIDRIEQIDVFDIGTIYISHNATTTIVSMTLEELCTLIANAKGG